MDAARVFELTPNNNGTWTKSTIYAFQGVGSDGNYPLKGVVLDQAGNVYGTTSQGGSGGCSRGCGTVFELSPSGSGWTRPCSTTLPMGRTDLIRDI